MWRESGSQSAKFTGNINKITSCQHTYHLALYSVPLTFWWEEFSLNNCHSKSCRSDPCSWKPSIVTRHRLCCHERQRLPCELNDSLQKIGQQIQLGMSKPLCLSGQQWAFSICSVVAVIIGCSLQAFSQRNGFSCQKCGNKTCLFSDHTVVSLYNICNI